MLLPVAYTLRTARCLLRQGTENDLSHTFSASRYEGFNSGMVWDPPDTAADCLAHHLKALENWNQGTSYVFTITLHNGTFVGKIGIYQDTSPHWSLGFWTHPIHQGQGFMTEVTAAIIQLGFETLGASEISAQHASWNTASQRVMENVGMTWRKHIPEGFQKNGQWVTEEERFITLKEWQNHSGEDQKFYTYFYLHRVSKNHVKDFLKISKTVAEIYEEYGASEGPFMRAVDLTGEYGCAGFADIISCSEHEELFITSSTFPNRQDHHKICSKIDDDPRIQELFHQFKSVVDISRVVRGGFETAPYFTDPS